MAKSKVSTPVKNDPCQLSAFMLSGLNGLSIKTPILKFRPTFAGYLDVVQATYEKMRATDRYFAREITYPMFQYYCCIVLYARILHLREEFGDDEDLLNLRFTRILPANLALPQSITIYLDSIGEIANDSGSLWRPEFTIPSQDEFFETIRGAFDIPAVHTHYNYLDHLSPGICLYAVSRNDNRT